MRFSEVRHQDRALSILRRALGSGRTHHAYLFAGPEGVGKELAARALASRLLCEDETLAPEADACGRCGACRLVASDNHPDLHVIHRGLRKFHPDPAVRARKGLFLTVDLVRHFVIEPAGMKPTQGRRRVFLIREAERMNEEAQNALLKTLEEPPGTACLILVTASAGRLLPTIRSRCQSVPFGLLPPEFVAQELRARAGVSAADAAALAGLSGGRLGVALHWQRLGVLAALDVIGESLDGLPAGDVEAFGKRLVELATELAKRARPGTGAQEEQPDVDEDEEERPAKAGGRVVPTDELRDALKLALALVAALYREALLVKVGASAIRHLPQQQRRAEALADGASLDRLDASLRAVSEAERMLDTNVAPQLACERLAVGLLGELPV